MTYPDKRFLRTTLLTDIASLPKEKKQEEDAAILARVFASPEYQQAQTIFAYLSMPHEIDTRPLLQKILADGKTLALPLCLPEWQMEARIVYSLEGLQKNAYGIKEPSLTSPLLRKEEIDLAIIPCLGATIDGYRLGHGGGYYDRYFADYLPPSILMCRSRCLLQQFPQEEYDIRIPIVITEKETYR